MLKFDAETAKLLDIAYQGADITRRRQATFDALKPAPGETILDIGCGNGLLTAELARAVGPSGRIIGIDPSSDMMVAAKERCGDYECVELRAGFRECTTGGRWLCRQGNFGAGFRISRRY